MASTTYTIKLEQKTGDDAYPTVKTVGSAVSAMTATESGGTLTLTCTTA